MNSDLKNHGRLTAAGWLVVRLSPGILSRPAFFFWWFLCSRQPTFCFQVFGHTVCRITCFCLHPHLHGVLPTWLISSNSFVSGFFPLGTGAKVDLYE